MKRTFSELDLINRYPFSTNDPVLIDVGAHHGHVSTAFAIKGWQVIAFEPEKRNRAAFLRNTKDYPKVTCFDKAVSDKPNERVPFYVSKEHFGIHSLKPFHETHELAYEVETVRLDTVLQKMDVTSVTCLKVDTEGADFLALKGFNIEKYQPELIMLEFMDTRSSKNFGYDHHDVVSYMEDMGYVAFVSEWAPIKEYGREGIDGEPHTWLQCAPYPLDHDLAWGNLIFVPKKDQAKFSQTLESYLDSLNATIPLSIMLNRFRTLVARIPGAKWLYRAMQGK